MILSIHFGIVLLFTHPTLPHTFFNSIFLLPPLYSFVLITHSIAFCHSSCLSTLSPLPSSTSSSVPRSHFSSVDRVQHAPLMIARWHARAFQSVVFDPFLQFSYFGSSSPTHSFGKRGKRAGRGQFSLVMRRMGWSVEVDAQLESVRLP